MNVKTYRLEEVYIEALRLHKLSWKRRLEGKNSWYKKDTFDDSHLPANLYDGDYRTKIYDKLLTFINPMYILRDGSGRFGAHLTFNEALHLLLAPEFLNINYCQHEEVDLGNYNLMTNTFVIQIME